jgi:NitT/TauT family transport system permease protein
LRASRAAGYLLAAVIVGLAWQLASWASGNLIPGPAPAMAYLAGHPGPALGAVALTLIDAVGGYAVAASLAILGLAIYELGGLGEPVVESFREVLHSVTPVAWSLALLILLGFSSRAVPILVSGLSAFPPLMTSLIEGLKASRARFGDLAAALRLRGVRRMAYIDLPASVPYFISGSRSAIGVALIVSPVAEAFGTAGGIGYGLYLFFQLHEYAAFVAWSLLLVLVMIVIDAAALGPLERWSRRWME